MKKFTTAEKKAYLIARVESALKEGLSPQEAIDKSLTIAQYDWLIDHDWDPDALLLTQEQRQDIQEMNKKAIGRRKSPNGYNKKYPQEKQNLYNSIVELLQEQGAEIEEKEKVNFRDLDFTLAGTRYRIVLSCPKKQ